MAPEAVPARSTHGVLPEQADSEPGNRSLAALIDNLPGMVYRRRNDARWSFLFVSEGCTPVTGWSSADLVEQRVDFGDLIEPEDRRAALERVQAAVSERRGYQVTYRIRSREGRQRWLWELGCGVFDGRGELLALEGVILDVSQQKALEEKLAVAKKYEAVGRLAGGLAHDFNNLLTATLGYSDMLVAQLPAGSNEQRQATRILQAAQRASELTRRLLSFSRRRPVAARVFDLSELVLSIDPMLRRLVGEDVELVTLLAHEAVPIEADPGQIEQVLVHMVVNARQAMPAGGKLTIQVQRTRMDEPAAELAVTDTGRSRRSVEGGEATRPSRAEVDAAPELALLQEIAEQAGGRIELEGEHGHGSSLRLLLPLARRSASARPTETPEPPTRGRGETVLVVEDEPLVRQIIVEALEAQGYQVLVARSGGEALELARRSPVGVDVLVADLVLPLMSGAEVARHVRELQPEVRVLIVSGYGDPRPDDRAGPAPATTFLAKPFTPHALTAAVGRLLESSASAGTSACG